MVSGVVPRTAAVEFVVIPTKAVAKVKIRRAVLMMQTAGKDFCATARRVLRHVAVAQVAIHGCVRAIAVAVVV